MMLRSIGKLLLILAAGAAVMYSNSPSAEEVKFRDEVAKAHTRVDALPGVGNYNPRLDARERDWMYEQMKKIRLTSDKKPFTPENLDTRRFHPNYGDYWNFNQFFRFNRLPQRI